MVCNKSDILLYNVIMSKIDQDRIFKIVHLNRSRAHSIENGHHSHYNLYNHNNQMFQIYQLKIMQIVNQLKIIKEQAMFYHHCQIHLKLRKNLHEEENNIYLITPHHRYLHLHYQWVGV